MQNERLRSAMLEHGLTNATLAEKVGVDATTVERWITTGRPPYRKTRYKVATELGIDEAILWPDALSADQVAAAAANELITLYPHRWAVPDDLWDRLFTAAQREIDILVYSGLFLAEDTGVQRLLAARARAGVRIRLLLGDPGSDAVAERGGNEGIDDAMAARIRNALVLLRPLLAIDGVEARLHRTVLYNSIYRADDQAS
jgi:transcriptional regulator with XRE-family HTH domain